MNIIITGQRHVGKTTLIQEVIKELQLSYAGYCTVPDQEYEIGWSYDMVNLMTHEKMPISCFDGQCMKGISETFETFGVECLKQSLNSCKDIIVLDEIGRFERKSALFLSMIHHVLDSSYCVLAVVKAEKIDYLQNMKARKDCLLLDLDVISYKEAKTEILSVLNTKGEML